MATKDTNYLVAVHKGLDESLEKQVAALPEKFNKQRFLQNCMTVLQDGQADFSKCEAPTVVRTLLKGAFLTPSEDDREDVSVEVQTSITLERSIMYVVARIVGTNCV